MSGNEDRIAAVALGKTVAFILYSLLAGFVAMAVTLIGPVATQSDAFQRVWLTVVWTVLELTLLVVVAKGLLPSTSGDRAEAFSEVQAAAGFTILSVGVLVWPTQGPQTKEIIQLVVNGGLAGTLMVYFVAKTYLARRPAWGVLAVAVLPVAQLFVVKSGPSM